MGNVTCELMNGRVLLDDFTGADREAVDNRSKAIRLIRDGAAKRPVRKMRLITWLSNFIFLSTHDADISDAG